MRTLSCVTLLAALLAHAVPARAQAPNVVTRESTVTATVDRIERSTRLVTVRAEGNRFLTVYVDPAVTVFDQLQTGDTVTVHYIESLIVQVRPNATLSEARDTTADAKKAGQANVVEQQKAVVTIESIDPQGLSVTYRTAAGLKAMHVVTDKRLLDGLHAGDRVEVTLTRERAIAIDRRH